MNATTVFLILDAGRSDYVQADTTPFLHGLQEDGLTAHFKSPPGFAQRSVFFTGQFPDSSGNFSAYMFDPEDSPFSWTDRLGGLARLVRPRKLMWPARWGIDQVTSWVSEAHHTDPAWIPPEILPYFRPCEDMDPVDAPEALGAPSVFDLCREHGLEYRYLAHPVSGDDDEIFDTLVRELRDGPEADVYVAQFSATDEEGHQHGPHGAVMEGRVLPDVDAKVASIHAALEAGSDDWNLLVCGDHGMAPVKRRVDVLDHLDQAHATHGRDYVVFVNSTIAVVWYLTERGRREVDPLLEDVPASRILDDADRRDLRIPRGDRWGDRMLAASPGTLYWPDYFHVTDSTIEGMHGYVDKRTEGLGLGVLASSRERLPRHDVGVRSLVDVFPTLCDLLDVPPPPANEGRSLLEADPLEDATPDPGWGRGTGPPAESPRRSA